MKDITLDDIKSAGIDVIEMFSITVEDVIYMNHKIQGIYVIYIDCVGNFGYIGKSFNSVKSRLRSHIRETWHKKLIKRIDVFHTETKFQIKELEAILIDKFKPELNTQTPKNSNDKLYVNKPFIRSDFRKIDEKYVTSSLVDWVKRIREEKINKVGSVKMEERKLKEL